MIRNIRQMARWGAVLLLGSAVAPTAAAQFNGQYFAGQNFDSLLLQREDAQIDFAWALGAPDDALPADGFSARWTGSVIPGTSEAYTFHATYDDGMRFYLDGQLLVDDWTTPQGGTQQVTVDLVTGQSYEVMVEYTEATGNATARLEWESPTQARQAVTTGRQGGLDQLHAFANFFGGTFPETTPSQGGLVATAVSPDLRIGMILTISRAPGSDVLYAGSRDGRVHRVDPYDPTSIPPGGPTSVPFLDLSDRVWTGQDSGLLGLAFHPEYATPGSDHEGEVYVYYIWNQDPESFLRLSRFQLHSNGTYLDVETEEVLIQQRLTGDVHRGGGLLFGNDGYLYLSIGELDLHDEIQRLDHRFAGVVLRIDVDQNPGNLPITVPLAPEDPESFNQGYLIPADNPFLGVTANGLEEIYAMGLRNPHRMTVDEASGAILIGDVGSAGSISREEINLLQPSANYGWPFREGTHDLQAPPATLFGKVTDPTIHYPRAEGACVIGGFVYRGSMIPWLQGRYVFGDYTTGKVYAALDEYGSGPMEFLGTLLAGLVTFGTDNNGELYIGGADGALYRLEAATVTPEPPATLSATGVFSDLATLTTVPGFVAYDVNAPLWSDNAEKKRWFAIPQDGHANAPWERIGFSLNGTWTFPHGSVFIKHFELPQPDGSVRRLETRFMVHGNDNKYYGMTYRWRPDGSDADLLTDALTEDVGNGQTWTYPGRDDCMRCHNETSGYVLGLGTAQFNGDRFYPETGRTANQLTTLSQLNLLHPPQADHVLATAPQTCDVDDASMYLRDRARSYLESNCAHCHLPDGIGRGNFDTRYSTPLGHQGLILGAIAEDLGMEDPKVIDPQHPESSMLLQRILAEDEIAMAPLGRDVVHPAGTELIEAWIQAANLPASNFQVEVYSTNNLMGLVDTISDTVVQYDWGVGAPLPGMSGNQWSLRISANLVPTHSGPITFYCESDDGIRLYVDGQLLIDAWDENGLAMREATIPMVAGQPAQLVLEYRERTGLAQLRLDWGPYGKPRKPVTAVDPVNTAPTAYSQQLVAPRDGELAILLEGTDLEQAGLDVALRSQPAHGTLTGIGPNFVYRPVAGYEGPDSFEFVVYDGELESAVTTVEIQVECQDCGGVQSYCETSANSVGAGAILSAAGSLSVSAADLTLRADGAVPGQFGIFYYGAGQASVPFGEGVRCVTAGGVGVFRFAPVQADMAGVAQTFVDYANPPTAAGEITPGSIWNFQFWYRDPKGGGSGFNLSDALQIQFQL